MDTAMQSILAGVVRHALTTVGGMLVSQGVIGSDQVNGLVGAGMIIAGVAWSWWQKVGQQKAAAELSKLQQKGK